VPANRFPCLDPRPIAGGGGYVECQGACLNGAAPGTCLETRCTADRDCLPGFRCASGITGRSDSAFWRFDCQRPDDACVRDDDCPPVDGGPARLYACQSAPAGRRCE
jgi:hypothetical protein